MPSRYLTRRFAARARARQEALDKRLNAVGRAVDAAARREWLRLWRELKGVTSPWVAQRIASARFRALRQAVADAVAAELRKIAVWGRLTAVEGIREMLPTKHLRAAARGKYGTVLGGHVRRLTHLELRAPAHVVVGESYHGRRHAVALLEDESSPGSGTLTALDLLAPLRDPGELTDAEQRELFLSLLFPPVPEERVKAHVDNLLAGLPFAGTAHRWPPEKLADKLAGGYAAGKTQQEIIKDLLPLVDGVRSSARRVARTWGIHVAHAEGHAAHEALGDLIVGYELLSVRGENSRPWHAARHGRKYYRHPEAGQDGFDKMPHPPHEPADPAERPPGTPALAWNCLCITVPVLANVP